MGTLVTVFLIESGGSKDHIQFVAQSGYDPFDAFFDSVQSPIQSRNTEFISGRENAILISGND